MFTVITLLCTVAGYAIAQPIINAMRAHAQAQQLNRYRSGARMLRALRTGKGR